MRGPRLCYGPRGLVGPPTYLGAGCARDASPDGPAGGSLSPGARGGGGGRASAGRGAGLATLPIATRPLRHVGAEMPVGALLGDHGCVSVQCGAGFRKPLAFISAI